MNEIHSFDSATVGAALTVAAPLAFRLGPVVALMVFALFPRAAQAAVQADGPPDFDGDGFSDLAVGVPGEDLSSTGTVNAGAVNVIYGTAAGLSSANAQLWTQNSGGVEDDAELGDRFGQAVAHGDFDADGFDDLAVGVPFEDLGAIADAGVVHVLFGSPLGLASSRNELWHQDVAMIPGMSEDGDRFGWSVAGGDFNGDGFDDLAVGVIGDLVEFNGTPMDNAGSVNVLYGSATGLRPVGSQIWNEKVLADNPAVDDLFGWALTSGDFDGDGFDELIIGVPFEDTAQRNTGIVYRLIGTAGGLDAGDVGFQFYLQGHKGVPDINCPFQPFPEGCQEIEDQWGYALSAGDYDGDGFDDLAVGVPGEEYNDVISAGQVHVLYGSNEGPVRSPSQLWNQDEANVLDQNDRGDRFGFALSTGDFNGDGFDELAVGVPMEALAGTNDAGQVQIFLGSASKLTTSGQQLWNQNTASVLDQAERLDMFGEFLSTGDYDGDGRDDLAVGVPREDLRRSAVDIADAGAVNVLYGASSGVSAARDQLWHQDRPEIPETGDAGDEFGTGMTVR